jgi:hypothetical protein
MKVPEDQLDHT